MDNSAWAASIASDFDLVCLDVDGTLVHPHGGREFRREGHAEDWQVIRDRDHMVQALIATGVQCCIVTNQGGVAFGYFNEGVMQRETCKIGAACGIPAAQVFMCFTHPKASIGKYLQVQDARRKPGPGMIQEAMALLKVVPDRTLMIGDRGEDQLAADTAGVHFLWADTFFDDQPYGLPS